MASTILSRYFLAAVFCCFLCWVSAFDDFTTGYDFLCDEKNVLDCECPTDDTTSTVNCSNRAISSLPDDISFPSGVKEVNFRRNKIKSINDKVFSHGIGITHLDLSRNAINVLGASVFFQIGNLESLDLSHNAIWSIGMNVFDGLTDLETLDLSYNNIGLFFGEIFKPCENLLFLTMKYNPLMSINENNFMYLKRLEKLDLQSTGIAFLQEDVFSNNTALTHLILAGNSFKNVPMKAVGILKNLQHLDLSQNPIETIKSGDFSGLERLKVLVLNNMNCLTSIKDHSMTKLPGLEELLMSHNPELTSISPYAFKDNDEEEHNTNITSTEGKTTTNLRRLYLRHNNLKTLPETLLNWKALDIIEIQDNPWNCDCHISWMASSILRRAVKNKLSCMSPNRLQGRKFESLGPTDFSCDYLSPAAIIGLSLLTLGAFSLLLSGTAFLMYRHKVCTCLKVRKQNGYARVTTTKERVDLEWDHTAEPAKDA